jgi:hypothetical protein
MLIKIFENKHSHDGNYTLEANDMNLVAGSSQRSYYFATMPTDDIGLVNSAIAKVQDSNGGYIPQKKEFLRNIKTIEELLQFIEENEDVEDYD